MFIILILETGILCISFGNYNRNLLLRILGIWCPSPHLQKGNIVSETGSVFVQVKVREGTNSLCSYRWTEISTNPIHCHLKTNTEYFRESWVLFFHIRHWTNSRNPVVLNVLCRHQNALGLTEFSYWGDKNPTYGKRSRIYSESINPTHFFFFTVGLAIAKYGHLRLKCFSNNNFYQKVIMNSLSLSKVKVT
jgi:hypothetical protein